MSSAICCDCGGCFFEVRQSLLWLFMDLMCLTGGSGSGSCHCGSRGSALNLLLILTDLWRIRARNITAGVICRVVEAVIVSWI